MMPARVYVDAEFIATFMSIGDELRLCVFEENHAPRRFYQRLGFELVRSADGDENDKRTPDAEPVWQAAKGGKA